MSGLFKKRSLVLVVTCTLLSFTSSGQTIVLDVIREGVKKAIKAVDLKIQRIQTKTIWLQNAEKEIENKMQLTKLNSITDWVNRQRKLYEGYYNELWQVKQVISGIQSVQHILNMEKSIARNVASRISQYRQDRHFTVDEFQSMSRFMAGILAATVKVSDHFQLAIKPSLIQTSDGQRLLIIHQVEQDLEQISTDLAQFNDKNILLTLQRSHDANDVTRLKLMYGLN